MNGSNEDMLNDQNIGTILPKIKIEETYMENLTSDNLYNNNIIDDDYDNDSEYESEYDNEPTSFYNNMNISKSIIFNTRKEICRFSLFVKAYSNQLISAPKPIPLYSKISKNERTIMNTKLQQAQIQQLKDNSITIDANLKKELFPIIKNDNNIIVTYINEKNMIPSSMQIKETMQDPIPQKKRKIDITTNHFNSNPIKTSFHQTHFNLSNLYFVPDAQMPNGIVDLSDSTNMRIRCILINCNNVTVKKRKLCSRHYETRKELVKLFNKWRELHGDHYIIRNNKISIDFLRETREKMEKEIRLKLQINNMNSIQINSTFNNRIPSCLYPECTYKRTIKAMCLIHAYLEFLPYTIPIEVKDQTNITNDTITTNVSQKITNDNEDINSKNSLHVVYSKKNDIIPNQEQNTKLSLDHSFNNFNYINKNVDDSYILNHSILNTKSISKDEINNKNVLPNENLLYPIKIQEMNNKVFNHILSPK